MFTVLAIGDENEPKQDGEQSIFGRTSVFRQTSIPLFSTPGATQPPRFPFGATLEIETKGAVLALKGELCLVTGPSLQTEIELLLVRGVEQVVLDLADLQLIDASGISLIVALQNRMEAFGGWVELLNPRGLVRKVLDICGLTRLISVHE